MNVFKDKWETDRCFVQEVEERDLHIMESIFADNADAVSSQGVDCQPERLASVLLRHEGLPPGGDSSQEQTFLIADKVLSRAIGLLSFYCGFPTSKTIYIGSLFFLRDSQGQGFGREVIDELERFAFEKGYQAAHVAVGLKNWPALRFWIALGFDRAVRIAGDKSHAEDAYADIQLAKKLGETG